MEEKSDLGAGERCIVCGSRSRAAITRSGYHILHCPACDLRYVKPSEIASDYSSQYEEDQSSPSEYYSLTEQYDTKTFNERLRFLRRYFSPKAKLLEIGCNTGTFLVLAKKYFWSVTGVEPNKSACKTLEKRGLGIPVYNKMFNSDFAASHKERYGMIYSSDVIEHVPNPVQFLLDAKSLLKQDGIIVTVTPDFSHPLTRLFQIKPTEHLIYLNHKSARRLYQKAGLNIIWLGNVRRYRNIKALLRSTTFTNKNNQGKLMPIVKLVNLLRLNSLIELALSLSREDMMIIAKQTENP